MGKKIAKSQVVKRQKTPDARQALLVSDRVQLRDVRLIKCECRQMPEASFGRKDFGINYSTEAQVDKKNGYVFVIPQFHFEAFVEAKTKEPAVVIDASFLLAYKIENFNGLTKKAFELFANINGIYNAWPYWREFVQNSIVRMGLPSLSIPVFRIVESPKENTVGKKSVKKRRAKRTAAVR